MKHQAKKRFGQNFLHDENIIDKIVEFIEAKTDEHIVEIGPGMGAITHRLLPHVAKLTAVEIDRDLIAYLEKFFSDDSHFHLVNEDVLKFDFSTLAGTFRVVGNLPYNISTPLLFHLFEYTGKIIDLHVMLQKEVIDRIKAEAGSKSYGRLSVMTQYHCAIGRDFFISASSFKPKPKVDSAFMRLTPHKSKPYTANDYGLFANIVRDAFNMRRKQLKNSLSQYISAEQLETISIDPSRRPESLTVQEYVNIANNVQNNTKE